MGSAGGDGNDSVNPIHVDLVVRDGVARARKSRGASRLYEMSSEPGLRAEASPESDNNAHVGQVEEAKDDELREDIFGFGELKKEILRKMENE